MNETPLNDRAQTLLRLLIERYISDGVPVGSRTLAADSQLNLSPATIRHVLADLEDMGLLASPHTSAGRVPTAQGYRVFVDSLLTVQPLGPMELDSLKTRLTRPGSEAELLRRASGLMSEVSQMAGIVTLPRHGKTTLRQVEFLPLSERRVLVVLVINDQEVQNRIIHVNRPYQREELQRAANYLNEHLVGRSVEEVKQRLIRELESTKAEMDRLMVSAMELARAALGDEDGEGDYVLSGETQLMRYQDISDMEKLRSLFEAFSEKQELLHLFENVLQADGVQIFIGEESGYRPLNGCSVVTAPYSVDGQVLGVLGIIGPTRMNYRSLIPMVDVTARLLGAALKSED